MLSDDQLRSLANLKIASISDPNQVVLHGEVVDVCMHDFATELLRCREALREISIYEVGGKYCVHCGEKSGWEEVRSKNMDLTYHPESCVMHEVRACLPEHQEVADAVE